MAELQHTTTPIRALREGDEGLNTTEASAISFGADHPSEHHHYLHSAGRRIRHFLLPNGNKIHVAQTPEEADTIRRKLTTANANTTNIVGNGQHPSDPLSNDLSKIHTEKEGHVHAPAQHWDVVIHGDTTHLDLLQQIHNWHLSAREELRSKHGSQFDEYERLIRELDHLSYEINTLSSETNIQLDANFEKYGYSAHLRTRDDSASSSSTDLIANPHEPINGTRRPSSLRDWSASKSKGQPMRFWQKPVLRQYFHKGLLWRQRAQQETKSYELFIDLFYVAIIDISGEHAAEEANEHAVLTFAYTFILAWKFWTDISLTISWFDADDVVQRLTTLFALVCLLGLTVNITGGWEETYTSLVGFYLASRFFMALYYIAMAWIIPLVRPAMLASAILIIIPALLWIGSIQIHDPWTRQSLIWPAIFLDLFGYSLMVYMMRAPQWTGPRLSTWLKSTFAFVPGANIEHKIERTNAFVALVFGYSVVSLLYQSAVPMGINAFFGKACLGLIQAFAFNWLYFEIDTFNLHTHAIRRHIVSAMVWLSMHLPFVMAYVLSSAAQAKIVVARDAHDTELEYLTESSQLKSEDEVATGLRWFYCAGTAISLASLGVINACHVYRTIPNQRLSRPFRLGIRFAASLAILLLPLAGDTLNSLSLIATTTCLVVFVLIVELAGSLCPGDTFWGFRTGECRKRVCAYEARCGARRRDVEESRREMNGEVDVEGLASRHGGGRDGDAGLAI